MLSPGQPSQQNFKKSMLAVSTSLSRYSATSQPATVPTSDKKSTTDNATNTMHLNSCIPRQPEQHHMVLMAPISPIPNQHRINKTHQQTRPLDRLRQLTHFQLARTLPTIYQLNFHQETIPLQSLSPRQPTPSHILWPLNIHTP